MDNDLLIFADEREEQPSDSEESWKVLIVDDEQEVHHVTKLVLRNFTFEDKRLHFIDAYSAHEAKTLIAANQDLAVILLDVVMESDQAGLDVVRFVRHNLKNYFPRIVLRTGQPGQAPEQSIIADFDINDYREKTELTSEKLRTLLFSCLRSYRDLINLHNHQNYLENVVESSARIFETQNTEELPFSLSFHLASLLSSELELNTEEEGAQTPVFCCHIVGDHHQIAAAIGTPYQDYIGSEAHKVLSKELINELSSVQRAKNHMFINRHCWLYFTNEDHSQRYIIFAETPKALASFQQELLEVFAYNVTIAIDKIFAIESKNREIQRLERKNKEMADLANQYLEQHFLNPSTFQRKLVKLCEFIANKLSLQPSEMKAIQQAFEEHYVGKLHSPPVLKHQGDYFEQVLNYAMRNREILIQKYSNDDNQLPIYLQIPLLAEAFTLLCLESQLHGIPMSCYQLSESLGMPPYRFDQTLLDISTEFSESLQALSLEH